MILKIVRFLNRYYEGLLEKEHEKWMKEHAKIRELYKNPIKRVRCEYDRDGGCEERGVKYLYTDFLCDKHFNKLQDERTIKKV